MRGLDAWLKLNRQSPSTRSLTSTKRRQISKSLRKPSTAYSRVHVSREIPSWSSSRRVLDLASRQCLIEKIRISHPDRFSVIVFWTRHEKANNFVHLLWNLELKLSSSSVPLIVFWWLLHFQKDFQGVSIGVDYFIRHQAAVDLAISWRSKNEISGDPFKVFLMRAASPLISRHQSEPQSISKVYFAPQRIADW